MPQLSRGQKTKLADLTPALQLSAQISAQATGLSFDFSCFGIDAKDKLSDDRYFVFYNQTSSPEGAIKLERAGVFVFDLSRVPASITRLVFVATIDGNGTMANLQNGAFTLSANGSEVARFELVGKDYGAEKAVMVAEIYRKDVWRVAAVGQGFAGGLDAVLKHFGGEISEEVAPAKSPNPQQSEDAGFLTHLKNRKKPSRLEPTKEVESSLISSPLPGVEKAPTGKVSLKKSQTVSLSKMVPQGLKKVTFGLGWDEAAKGKSIDLDGSCIAFDAQKKVLETIWFGRLANRDKTIEHSGDNLTGQGKGDDEKIEVDLERLDPKITTLVFTINSFSGQRFSAIRNAFCRVVDKKSKRELARYDLGQAGDVKGMIMAKVSRENGEWHMTAIGEPAGGITVHFLVKTVRKFI